MRITTKSGYEFDFDETVLDDWEFVKAIAAAEDTDNAGKVMKSTVKLVELIFGEDQEGVIKAIRLKNDGRAPIAVIQQEVTDIIDQVKEAKNSQSSQE